MYEARFPGRRHALGGRGELCYIIGHAPGGTMVSSFLPMLPDPPHHPKQGVLVFTDCGLVVEPDASELAGIALASARSFADLTGSVPKLAMLSFSTPGGARRDRVSKGIEATGLAREARPDPRIGGAKAGGKD